MARFQLDVHIDEEYLRRSMSADVRKGLTSRPRYLLPKYFYDEKGSLLFEQITELPEYYPTRTEKAILSTHADDIMKRVRPVEMVELGSGSSYKTRVLLDAGARTGRLDRYVPFDVSPTIVESTAQSLLADYPDLQVHGVIGDFERHLDRIPPANGPRLALFLGGTLGNLYNAERHALLTGIRGLLGRDDRLLLGVDLVKDVATLEAAYNDSAGVTAAFNLNILNVVNAALHADFNTEGFRHFAYYNQRDDRIEMHLVSRAAQTVNLRDLELTVHLDPMDAIWTESSHKFTRESISGVLERAGLRLDQWYTDDREMFGLLLAGPGP